MHPQLLQLLALNKGRGFFNADNTSAEEATIYLYDVIVQDAYWGGVAAIDFVKAMAQITAPVIHLRINSPGGDVFAARAMAQAIKETASTVIAHIDGYCASAATFLAIAASESVIANGGMFMIHNAWTMAAGNAKDFTEMATLLSRTDTVIAQDYANKTGKTLEEIQQLMDSETYYFGQEAVDAGFINAVADENTPKNTINWDLSAYGKPNIQSDDDKTQEKLDDIAIKQQKQINLNRLRLLTA